MLTRRRVLLASGICLLVAHRLGHGQPATLPRRVGILSSLSEGANVDLHATFTQAMRDLGWAEGKNIEYHSAYADGEVGRVDGKAAALIAQKVEVLVAASPAATRAAQRTTKTIPIVMVSVSNAVGNGFVASLARPGGNITGISNPVEETLGKLIEMLHEVVPSAGRIAILLNNRSPSYATYLAGAQAACAALGLVSLPTIANTPAELGAAVEQIVRQRSQGVVVVRDGMYLNERASLQKLMQATRLPVAYGFREHVIAGGLLSYATDLAANYRAAAKYVDKILKGAKPANLPVEQPTEFELIVNLNTAKALGVTIPQSVLLRANEVIQ